MTLRIAGRDYVVISEQSEEHLVRLGLLVERNIREVNEAFPMISTTDAAVMAALNIGDEYLQLQEKQKKEEQDVADVSERQADIDEEETKPTRNSQRSLPGRSKTKWS